MVTRARVEIVVRFRNVGRRRDSWERRIEAPPELARLRIAFRGDAEGVARALHELGGPSRLLLDLCEMIEELVRERGCLVSRDIRCDDGIVYAGLRPVGSFEVSVEIAP